MDKISGDVASAPIENDNVRDEIASLFGTIAPPVNLDLNTDRAA